jgi:hypothetical protein
MRIADVHVPVDERRREHAATRVDRLLGDDISQLIAFANVRNASITHDHRRISDDASVRVHRNRKLRTFDFQ